MFLINIDKFFVCLFGLVFGSGDQTQGLTPASTHSTPELITPALKAIFLNFKIKDLLNK